MKFAPTPIYRALALLCACIASGTHAQQSAPVAVTSPQVSQLQRVMQTSGTQNQVASEIGYARQQVLREGAISLGARAGLVDRSRDLFAVIDSRANALDVRFNFNSLVINNSVLPPVISESKDVVALEARAMRTAAGVFRIDEPARFAMPTPTWRDWLYLGLDAGEVAIPSLGANGPNSPAERALWEKLVKEGYEIGRKQAQDAFELNLARLERAHAGMTRYYDLWQRGMVSAPVIATSSEVVVREDDDTISVGNTLYRITQPADFRPHQAWKPLE